jgi:hypothetical protein
VHIEDKATKAKTVLVVVLVAAVMVLEEHHLEQTEL